MCWVYQALQVAVVGLRDEQHRLCDVVIQGFEESAVLPYGAGNQSLFS